MPNIQEYVSPVSQIRPDEQGPETLARTGRFIEQQATAAGAALGGAVAHVGGQIGAAIDQHNEMTDLASSLKAVSQSKLAADQEWQGRLKDAAASGNLDGAVQEQQQADGERWDNLLQNAQTDPVRKHLMEEQAIDMERSGERYRGQVANVSGNLVVSQLDQMSNNGVNRVMNDPDTFEDEVASQQRAVSAMISTQRGLTAEQSVALTEKTQRDVAVNLAKGTIAGMLHRTLPDGTPDLASIHQAAAELQAGRFNEALGGARDQVVAQTDEAVRYAKVAANSMQEAQVRAREQQSKTLTSTFLANSVTIGADGIPHVDPKGLQALVQNSIVDPSAKLMAIDLTSRGLREAHEEAEKGPLPNNPTIMGLRTQALTGDPNDVLRSSAEALASGKISAAQFEQSRSLIASLDSLGIDRPEVTRAVTAAKYQIVDRVVEPITGDPDGQAHYSNMVTQFNSAYMQAKRSGTLKPNALDLTDPTSMISQVVKANQPDPAAKVAKMVQDAQAGNLLDAQGIPKSLASRPISISPTHPGEFMDNKTKEVFNAFGQKIRGP